MATPFVNWTFGDRFADTLTGEMKRRDKVAMHDKDNTYRYQVLGESIEARKAMDAYREKTIAETIKHNRAVESLTGRGQDVTVRGQDKSAEVAYSGQGVTMRGQDKTEYVATRGQDMTYASQREAEGARKELAQMAIDADVDTKKLEYLRGVENREDVQEHAFDLYDRGKTREERQAKLVSKATVGGIKTFEHYDQDEAVTEAQDFLGFDEGEFTRASEQYISSISQNLHSIVQELDHDPNSAVATKHLQDLEDIWEVLDSGEYSGIFDSTVLDWVDGQATKAKKQRAQIEQILKATGREGW